jgi:hypothetical protein
LLTESCAYAAVKQRSPSGHKRHLISRIGSNAVFNRLKADSKLRGCDIVAPMVDDIASGPDGQITCWSLKALSSPARKNIPLNLSGKSDV